jgi:myo-inositol 2-dehydrogenase/D-chiro-inositol 1-dehydrogenase
MDTPHRARIGFVGAGNHATQALYPNLPLIRECQLAAVCDLRSDRAEETASAYGARAFTDCGNMLDAVELDGVCVCGMPDMHHEVGLAVLERGLPLFIEKPPAPTLEQARELAETAAENDTFGMVGFMKRFAPANVVTKELVDSDGFGDLASIVLIHGAGPYDDLRRMLMFNGIHPIDSARFFGGDVEAVSAYAHSTAGGVQSVSANLRFASGVPGQLTLNSGATWSDCYEYTYLAGKEHQVTVVGCRDVEVMSPQGRFAEARDVVTLGWSNSYYVSGTMSHWPAGGHYTRGYCGQLEHFVRAVLGAVDPQSTLADGVEAMRIIDGILRSVEEGREIRMTDITD